MHEATAYPGGRCRSYFDRAIGMTIDNGNHLVLSGNHAVRGVREKHRQRRRDWSAQAPRISSFPDLASPASAGRLASAAGLLPWWVFRQEPPCAGHGPRSIISACQDSCVADNATVRRKVIKCSGTLYRPAARITALLAALNIDPRDGAATLCSAVVRETLALGGAACRPLIARDGA